TSALGDRGFDSAPLVAAVAPAGDEQHSGGSGADTAKVQPAVIDADELIDDLGGSLDGGGRRADRGGRQADGGRLADRGGRRADRGGRRAERGGRRGCRNSVGCLLGGGVAAGRRGE